MRGPAAPSTFNRHTVTPRQWAPAGARVYEVAHNLELSSRDVVRALHQLEYFVRSANGRFPPRLSLARLVETVEALPARPAALVPPPAPAPPPAPVTAGEVARQLGVSPATVRQWVARGYLAPEGKRGSANLFNLDTVRAVQSQTAARRPRTAGDAIGSRGYVEPWAEQLRNRLDDIVTGPRAAELVGVAPSTVRMWVARGYLTPHTPGARPLFRVRDVLAVRRRKSPRQ